MREKNAWNENLNHIVYRAMFMLLLIGVAYVGYLWHLSYSGYCFKEHRYLADEELIQVAIRSYAHKMNIEISEESVRTFHAKHPKCCNVDRSSHMASSWFEKLIGGYFVIVEVNFELKPEMADRSTAKSLNFYNGYVGITSCGKRGRMYGEHSETLKDATQF